MTDRSLGWTFINRYFDPLHRTHLSFPSGSLIPLQKRFICTISGHSGLTFFQALKSEVSFSFTVVLALQI
jgi:hypothetical protein